MINFLNVNPFAEAMLYYWGRANDYGTEKRLAEVCSRYPEQKEALKQAVQPAFLIENLLDSKLNVNEKLLIKFFKNFDNRSSIRPFGFCLASIMIFFPLITHSDYSPEELCKYLCECTDKEQRYSLCFGLINEYEVLNDDESGIEEISRRIEELSVSFENKWKILNAAVNYNLHIDELLSLIIPAVSLIKEAQNEYESVAEEFRKRYSENNAQAFFKHKFTHFDIMNVTPIIFGFNYIFYETNTKDDLNYTVDDSFAKTPLIANAIIGIAQHIISGSSTNKVTKLSDKLKVLSDSSRLEILFYLCSHKAYGQELCSKFNIQQSTLSYHMSKLVTVGLVNDDVIGSKTYYSADREGIQSIIDAFAEKIA